METTIYILLVLGTQTLFPVALNDEKGLLMSDTVQLEREVQRLKSLMFILQSTLSNTSTKLAAMDSELIATKSELSMAKLPAEGKFSGNCCSKV